MSILSRLFHRDRPPVAALRGLSRDERVLAWATVGGESAVLATQLGLWMPTVDGYDRVCWHLVDKAVWRDGTLTVIAAEESADGVLDELPPRSVRLTVPRNLPATVRARVERSIGYTRHYPLEPSGGVRVVGRRMAGQDGLHWQLVFDRDTDRDDPLVRMQAGRLVEQSQVEIGVVD